MPADTLDAPAKNGRVGTALNTARDAANDALHETRKAAEANPLAAVGAGIAIGLVIGALLPRSRRETELLGSTGRRLTGAASEAVIAAREAAKAELGTLPLTRDAARAQVGKVIDQFASAISGAGEAALAGRSQQQPATPAAGEASTAPQKPASTPRKRAK